MDADERRRLERIEQAMFGFNGDNGVYGDMKELDRKVDAGFKQVDDRQSGLYKLLAVTALSVLGSSLGVVVTLLSTAH